MDTKQNGKSKPESHVSGVTAAGAEKPKLGLRHFVVPGITLIIALVGGVPGVLQSIEFFNKTSAKILFDPDNSRFIPISSHKKELADKTALVLLEIKVVGAGERSIYIAGLTTSVYYEGRWIRGIPFFPELHEKTDSEGIAKRYLKVTHKRDEDTTVVTYMNWNAFKAGQNVLSYGEPAAFSYVCYYDIPGEDRHAISRLRVRINDYLGNSYETTVATDSLMLERLAEVALVAD